MLLWSRPIFLGCYGGQIGNVSCCIHSENDVDVDVVKLEWKGSGRAIGWRLERQSEKGMEEFDVTELVADPGCFHSFLRMTHDQFMELLTYVEPTIIGCDTMMRECITPHEMSTSPARGPRGGRAVVWRPALLNIFAAISK